MGKELPPSSYTSSSSLSKPRIYVFYFFLFAIGLSVGVLCTLYFTAFPLEMPPALFTIQTPPPPLPPPPRLRPLKCIDTYSTPLMHNMSDRDLLRRASVLSRFVEPSCKFTIVPKVAFMFLTPGPLPLAPLWEVFFRGHNGHYSIYVHPHPSYKGSWPPDSVFYGRRITSQPVSWGRITMIDAERRLLANALLDISNQRFVLFSDSCIPVSNFTTVYNYLMRSEQSYLESYDEPGIYGRGRYSPKMKPTVSLQQWRKGSQWFELRRDLAVMAVSDQKYYGVFRRHCLPACYPDEHYLQTMVNILCPEKISNRSITWVDWSRRAAHPRSYGKEDVTGDLLDGIQRQDNCTYNGKMNAVCYLFARKFLPDTIEQLLWIGPAAMGLKKKRM